MGNSRSDRRHWELDRLEVHQRSVVVAAMSRVESGEVAERMRSERRTDCQVLAVVE